MMLHQSFALPAQSNDARAIAEQAGISALLRAFCREIAAPHGRLAVVATQPDRPMPAVLVRSPHILELTLPDNTILTAGVEATAPLHDYRLCSPVFARTAHRYERLEWRDVAVRLYAATQTLERTEANDEILSQTANSIDVTTRLITHRLRHPALRHLPVDPVQAYLRSEGNLLFGHGAHPSPKSREGVDLDQVVRHAPETEQPFDLAYFAVDPGHLWQRATGPDTANAVLSDCLPNSDAAAGEAVIPVHPLQAAWLRRQPPVIRAIEEGWLHDLGPIAKPYHATSSVRTLLNPDDRHFLKLSLNVRLTNCVRKNAVYELEGAVALTAWLEQGAPARRALFPHLRILDEPASLSIDAPHFESPDRTLLMEGFGIILRTSLLPDIEAGEVPMVAGGLFCPAFHGPGWLDRIAGPDDTMRVDWLDRYASALIAPVLHCYFHEGIVFEPHLQNLVIGLVGSQPDKIYLRDLEGAKLTPRAKPMADASDAVRRAIIYGEEAGWRRIAYCLFVNNLGEAVHHLSVGRPGLARRLWDRVGGSIDRYQREHGTAESAARLKPLLAGASIPTKSLLLTRFRRQSDREAGYVLVTNPMAARA